MDECKAENTKDNNIDCSTTILLSQNIYSNVSSVCGKLDFYKSKGIKIKFRLKNKPNYEFSGKIVSNCNENPYIEDGTFVIFDDNSQEMMFTWSEVDHETIIPIGVNPILYFIRPSIPDSVRQAVFNRDSHTCQHRFEGCSGKDNLEIDHIIPISLGGLSDIQNLVTSCSNCNKRKGNRMVF